MNKQVEGNRRRIAGGDLGSLRLSPLSPLPSPLPRSRRGVLLIVVLAVLAMFALIAMAFVVISGHAQRGAKSMERFEQAVDPPEKLLHQAAMQVFRGGPMLSDVTGAPDPTSVMGAHSLLEDIYGNDAETGTVTDASVDTLLPQLVNLQVSGLTTSQISRRIGCVLTITDLPNGSTAVQQALLGQSTRIVAASPASSILQIMAFPNIDDTTVAQLVGTKFIINGVPFSGTGFGYDSTANNLDLTYDSSQLQLSSDSASATNWPVALLPNLPLSIYTDPAKNPSLIYTFGGANEDYDAADFQNMLLAAQVPLYNASSQLTRLYTLPSLHRPSLVRYWMSEKGATSFEQDDWKNFAKDNLELCRKITLRPIGGFDGSDHPNFDGGNPDFNAAWNIIGSGGPWDVDNDGDGTMDSVWVDLGMPVRSTADGRLYKPLFAILCVDLDGRLNLNAHGSLPQTDETLYSTLSFYSATLADGPPPSFLGQGFGPADINPCTLLGRTYSQHIMSGDNNYQGRYGTDGDVGGIGNAYPGYAGMDKLNQHQCFNYGTGYGKHYWLFDDVNYAGSYGSPLDVFGVGVMGLHDDGAPVYGTMRYKGVTEVGFGCYVGDSPYELQIGQNQFYGQPSSAKTVDNPFSPAELERILRPFDRDAPSLPDRLAQLTTTDPGDPNDSILYNYRHLLTTESWDLPCPNVVTPSSMSDAERALIGGRVKHITDLLRARGVDESHFSELLPTDLLAGLRMNINRPFGNGVDDLADDNDVIDAPAETTGQAVTLSGDTVSSFSFDGTDGSTSGVTTSLAARQREARYLYVLACLTVDLDSFNSRFGDYTETARFLAQWAVNVVDFKDRDSIMTRFDYDPDFANPCGTISDGWNPTTAGTCTVWGCERPELLISETLAFHDRRTQDTEEEEVDTEEGDGCTDPAKTTADPPDASFDQVFKPQGSLFVELYNPWSDMTPQSGDLCASIYGEVKLDRLTPSTAGAQYPVWRLITVDKEDADLDPDDPEGFADSTKWPTIERAVYFVRPDSGATLPPDVDVKYYPNSNQAAKIAPIYSGGHVLIGSGESTDTTSSTTYLGFKSGETPGSKTSGQRRIVLTPSADPLQTGQVAVYNDGGDDDSASVINIHSAAVVISEPQRLNISEPNDGYTSSTSNYDPTNGYDPVLDIPLDISDAPSAEIKAAIMNDGRTDRVKVIHLQRLANPLKPYNNTPSSEDYNPYRTIDSMAVDLTAFNGVDNGDDPKVTTDTNSNEFYTRQRGQNNDDDPDAMNLWAQEPIDEENSPSKNTHLPFPPSSPTSYASFNLKWPLHHSFGILNDPFFDEAFNNALCPKTPFPWLTWLNRPYVSPVELMQVSWRRSSQLLGNYDMNKSGNPYTDASVPFPHLTNYFVSDQTSSSDEELHRLFEYLGVVSPFVRADIQANPNAAVNSANNKPPFNNISTYREPGRINLNTIYDQRVFNSLMNGSLADVSWSDFAGSRRGYPLAGLNHVLSTNASYPTLFARPFRSFGGAELVPSLGGDELEYDREIDATLLREGTSGTPLFQYESTNDVDNTERNPYFRYQGLQRLSNLVTTRSNVYAVWITVGYFEVEPATTTTHPGWSQAEILAACPDGYTLGQELGVDTGEIERHRAFYMFDRSIPVGFQRGKDLNVDKAILIERFIE